MRTLKNITIYKDFKLKEKWGQYDVEIKEDKARVLNEYPVFGEKSKSRFAKMHFFGGWGKTKLVGIKCNGYKVYFKDDGE